MDDQLKNGDEGEEVDRQSQTDSSVERDVIFKTTSDGYDGDCEASSPEDPSEGYDGTIDTGNEPSPSICSEEGSSSSWETCPSDEEYISFTTYLSLPSGTRTIMIVPHAGKPPQDAGIGKKQEEKQSAEPSQPQRAPRKRTKGAHLKPSVSKRRPKTS